MAFAEMALFIGLVHTSRFFLPEVWVVSIGKSSIFEEVSGVLQG